MVVIKIIAQDIGIFIYYRTLFVYLAGLFDILS